MEKRKELLEVSRQIENCKRCSLYKSANHPVPGEGNPEAEVVFIGEAPGFNEDARGRPFVGNAGKYLDSLLAKVGIKRENIYITNVVKHRPPENRDPSFSEIAACSAWLELQLKIINPKIVVTLGRHGLARFLPNTKIGDVHGKPFRAEGMVILPMYHPAAALRSSQTAHYLEEDFVSNRQLLADPSSVSNVGGKFDESGQGSLF